MSFEEIDIDAQILNHLETWRNTDKFDFNTEPLYNNLMWCSAQATKYRLITEWILERLQEILDTDLPVPCIDGEISSAFFVDNLMWQFEVLYCNYKKAVKRSRMQASIRAIVKYLDAGPKQII